jgi:hypothetical protein
MSYVEEKVDFLVAAAKKHCGTESTDQFLRQQIALDVLEMLGYIFHRPDPALLKKIAPLLSVMPLLKKDAEGQFKQSITEMEDAVLQLQLKLQSKCR